MRDPHPVSYEGMTRSEYFSKPTSPPEHTKEVSTTLDNQAATNPLPHDVPDGVLIDLFAECKDEDTSIFFPKQGESLKAAQAICARCVVKEECLEYAISNNIKFGVWGGKSYRQRRAIIRQRKKVANNYRPAL